METAPRETNLPRGIASGIVAGALWGIVFVAPRMLKQFSPLELVIGRYGLYGLFSLVLLAPIWRQVRPKVTRRDWVVLLRLSLTANIFYYLFLGLSVHLTGVAPAALIVGMLPLTITFAGSRDHGAMALRSLALPLLLIVAGIVCINLDVFLTPRANGSDLTGKILGIAAAIGALASWTDYAVANARYLHKTPKFTNREWSLLSGIATGALSLCLVPLALVFPGAQGARSWDMFLWVNMAVAIGSSVIGNSFWNAASRYLPLTLSGQMIVFETVFALLYGFLYEARLPSLFESAAIALLLTGVCWSMHKHRPAENSPL